MHSSTAYDTAGEHAKAAKTFEEGIRATPRLASQFALSAATSLLEGGDLAGAEAHAHAAESGDPAGAHLLLGEIALARGDLAAASSEATAAEQFRSQRAHALFLAARIAVAQHDFPRALALFDEVQRVRTETAESLPRRFHYAAADALARGGRMPEAMGEFEKALGEEPHNGQIYADLALLQFVGGERAAAEETLRRLVAANPDQGEFAKKIRARLESLPGRVGR